MSDSADTASGISREIVTSRLLPAALIDATLMVLCMFVALYLVGAVVSIGLYLWDYFVTKDTGVPHSSLYFVCFVPILAPALYRVMWQPLSSRRSAGERWRGIEWPVEQKNLFRRLLVDLSHGLVAFLVAVAICKLSWNTFEVILGHSPIPLIFVALTSSMLIYYWLILSSLLLLRFILIAKKHHSNGQLLLSMKPPETAHLSTMFVMFFAPYVLTCCAYFLTPLYFSTILLRPAAWLLFFLVSFWWAVGLILVTYWNSRLSGICYFMFFVFPGFGYLQMLPAVASI